MQQKQVHPFVMIAVVVVAIGGLVYFGFKTTQPRQPAAGSYTPGVPPWLDKNSPAYGKGPGFISAQKP